MQRQDVAKLAQEEYVNNNRALIDRALKLEDAVVALIKEKEHSEGFKVVHTLIKTAVSDMKKMAASHADFISNNKDGQIPSVKSNKAADIFMLGADMLTNIAESCVGNSVQVCIRSKYPIKQIFVDRPNVVSGGTYRVYDKSRNQVRQLDEMPAGSDGKKWSGGHYLVSKSGEGLKELSPEDKLGQYNYFYDNIAGSALFSSKQAMLITLYAALKGIDIIQSYDSVLHSLKYDGIVDYTKDANLVRQPIKNMSSKSPFSMGGDIVTPTALYEFGGTRLTEDSGKKPVFDCSQWIESMFKTSTMITRDMVEALEAAEDSEASLSDGAKAFRDKVLVGADRILRGNGKFATEQLLQQMGNGDMFVWPGHVGFIKMSSNGKPEMLSYTRERGETDKPEAFRGVVERTLDNFFGKRITDQSTGEVKFIESRNNTDGFTIEPNRKFRNLLGSKEKVFLVKFAKELAYSRNMPRVEDVVASRSI